MENKKLKEYLDEFKDDAALHVIVANPQDRKIYVPYELNMICDKGQKDPVLCIEVGQPQNMDAELVEAAMEDERAAQPELPKLKNNDQRKEWLRNYKDWGLWYHDDRIDVNYYKYDFEDGSRLIVAEYPKRKYYWNFGEVKDSYYFHLLKKNKKYYGREKTYDQQYVHTEDSETHLVEFLKNLQKGAK
ncbi:MAG: hypothetical protein ACLS9B_08760 [Coprococcus comes]